MRYDYSIQYSEEMMLLDILMSSLILLLVFSDNNIVNNNKISSKKINQNSHIVSKNMMQEDSIRTSPDMYNSFLKSEGTDLKNGKIEERKKNKVNKQQYKKLMEYCKDNFCLQNSIPETNSVASNFINENSCEENIGKELLVMATAQVKDTLNEEKPIVDFDTSANNDFQVIEKEKKDALVPLAELIKNEYRGATVLALLPNGVMVKGEVVFNFNHIVALKKGNSIIFINEASILAFY